MGTYSDYMVNPPTDHTIAQRVRVAMEEAGENAHSLAKATGVPRSTLERRLTGFSSFTVAEITALAPLLGTTRVELLADEPSVA